LVTLSECAVPLNTQTTDTSETFAVSLPLLIGLTLAVAVVSAMPVLVLKKTGHVSKQHSFKFVSLILCLLLASTMFMSLAMVSADPRRRSTIWGSESTGDPSRKTQSEINQQRATAQYISDYFKNDGYSASNEQGSKGSYRSQILTQISNNEANYDRVAVIDFNHGVGTTQHTRDNGEFHYLFEDNIGMDLSNPYYYDNNYVYDMDIYDQTTSRKTFFTFISTCMSANYTSYTTPSHIPGQTCTVGQGMINGNAQGMPYAWTHKLVTASPTTNPASGYMSSNGYTHPDSGAHCYMGFTFGSAALCQQLDSAYPTVSYYLWLQDFLYYALNLDITINQALDRASQNRFNTAFSGTKLYSNFDSIWPGMGSFPNCKLAVYGNGNLRLYEYFVHSPYVGSSSYLSGSVTTPNGFTGAQPDGSYTRLRAVNVNDQAMVTGSMAIAAQIKQEDAYGYMATPLATQAVFECTFLTTIATGIWLTTMSL
jgi:hypothetical protein